MSVVHNFGDIFSTCAESPWVIPSPVQIINFGICLISGLTALARNDPCAAFDDCASCTSARFHNSVIRSQDASFFYWSLHKRRATIQQILWSWVGFPLRRPSCAWCPVNKTCFSRSSEQSANISSIPYEFDCPYGPDPYPEEPPSLLPNWMGALINAGGSDFRLTDLCLPGTHNSMSYDLSLTVSDDGLDNMVKLSKILHDWSASLLPNDLEEFFRLQAKTHQLTITQQLDNGIRFIDFRIMMEQEGDEWYCIHFMQSKKRVQFYWRQIRAWLDQHPREIIVVFLSRHGDEHAIGDDQYAGVAPAQKQALWDQYTDIFSGLLMDGTVSSIHNTRVGTLLRRNHRVVTFATDYVSFTNRSRLALDGRKIQNFYRLDGVFDWKNHTHAAFQNYLKHADANNAFARAKGEFTLMSMNTAGPSWQIEEAARLRFLPLVSSSRKCAKRVNIAGVNHWCPETLLDIAQLSSFFTQTVMEEAWNHADAFPNAFYVDGLDYNGTIRTGTRLLDGAPRSNQHQDAKYAYVDTVVLYNVVRMCKTNDCLDLIHTFTNRRLQNPLLLWEDARYGRHNQPLE